MRHPGRAASPIHSYTSPAVDSFFFSSRRRHTRYIGDWSSDVCSSDLAPVLAAIGNKTAFEGNLLTFTNSATDADSPAQILTYSLIGAPSGRSEERRVGKESWFRQYATSWKSSVPNPLIHLTGS